MLWFALSYPSCLLGMPAIPQARPGILWEGTDGYRPQLYDESSASLAGCTANRPELKFDLVLELNTPDLCSVEMTVIFCVVILGCFDHI